LSPVPVLYSVLCFLSDPSPSSCRHLVFKLPGLTFADACHAGRFARCVMLRLLAVGMHSSSHAQLLVANKDGGLTTFLDMGVYTRNRWVSASGVRPGSSGAALQVRYGTVAAAQDV
jgi:hypothetical protein